MAFTLPLLILEVCSKVYLQFIPQTHYDFRKSHPPPYRNASYFSQKFIEESFIQPGGWHYPEGTRLVIPHDYSGTYFNVRNGIRVTQNQPERYDNAIYLFGGSTIYCSEVPDEYTVASQLQMLSRNLFQDRYIVHNYGTTAATVAQQLERLRTISLDPGDIVVFYDGINDIVQSIFYASPGETMVERNRRALAELSSVHRAIYNFHKRASKQSALVQLFMDPTDRALAKHYADTAQIAKLVEALKGGYKSSIEDAADYTMGHGGNFYHFLQPHIFARKTHSSYENRILKNKFITPKGVKKAFEIGHPALQDVVRELLSNNIMSYDLSLVLNKPSSGKEYFLDCAHVNHEANRIIAVAIFNRIKLGLKN
jgi:hypothetical protein